MLLSVVVAGKPPCGVVASHCKLGVLFLNKEIVERFLLRELISQSKSLVIYSESDDDITVSRRLVEVNLQFVVIIANLRPFTPYGSPCFVEGGCLGVSHLESVHKVGLVLALRGMLVLGKFESQSTGFNHSLVFISHFVGGDATISERELYSYVSVRRADALCHCHQRQQQSRKNCDNLFHTYFLLFYCFILFYPFQGFA